MLDLYVAPSSVTVIIMWLLIESVLSWLVPEDDFWQIEYLSVYLVIWFLRISPPRRLTNQPGYLLLCIYLSYLRATYDAQVWEVLLTDSNRLLGPSVSFLLMEVHDVIVIVLRKTCAEILRVYQFTES